MLSRKQFIKEYKKALSELKLDPSEMLVAAGGACLMYGIRKETSDIDVDVSQEIFLKLLKTKKYGTHMFGSTLVLEYNEYVDLHIFDFSNPMYEIVEGVGCYSPEIVLAHKLKLNREKDQDDIKGLQALIAKRRKSVGSVSSKKKLFERE